MFSSIDSVSPASGQLGTRVTISGTALLAGGTQASNVRLAGTNVRSIVSFNNTQGVVVVDFENVVGDRTGDVIITMDNGQTVWTYKVTGTIDSVQPASGQAGTLVTVTGTDLFGQGSALASATLAGTSADVVSANNSFVVLRASAASAGSAGAMVLTADTGAIVQLTSAWTYVNPQNIVGVSPQQGQVNTRVTITGTNLLGGGAAPAFALLAGVRTETFVSASATQVVAVAAASSAGAVGSIVLVADTGATVLRNASWQYQTAGAISSVSPASGQRGTIVEISGTNLLGYGASLSSVLLDGVAATIESQNNSYVRVRAGQGSNSTGDVVLVANTGATVTRTDAWTYIVPGAIATVTPSSGTTGTRVTIAGERLLGGGTSALSVTLNGVTVDAITSANNDNVTVVAAAPTTAAQGDVVITSDTGAIVTLQNGWTYLTPGNITSISRPRGRSGTVITLTGTGLLGGGASLASVLLGNETVESITSANNTVVVVVAGTGGVLNVAVDVTLVANTGARATLPNSWTVIAPGLIESVTPAQGRHGTYVTITGLSLLGGGQTIAAVSLADVEVEQIVSSNATIVIVRAGASTAKIGDVVVSSDSGDRVTKTNAWTYATPASVLSVSLTTGPVGTVDNITVSGLISDGDNLTSVTLAGIPALEFEAITNTLIRVDAGNGTTQEGQIVLTVQSGAKAVANETWKFVPSGVIDRISPSSGQAGSVVQIVGSGEPFLGGGTAIVSATLAGIPVERILFGNNTHVSVVAAHSPTQQTGDVVLRSNSGALTTGSGLWTYLAPGAIASVTPAFGQHGTEVVLQSTNLLGYGTSIAAASLAGVASTVVFANDTRVVLRAGLANATTGDIVLVSDQGIRVTKANGWQYRTPGQIADVAPGSGQQGTRAFIYGTRLRGHGARVVSVLLAGVTATIRQETDFFVEVVAGPGAGGTTGDVTLVADSGAIVTQSDGWTYLTPGNITSVSPASGSFGTVVTLAGSNLLAGGAAVTSVALGQYDTALVSATNTQIVVQVAERGAAGSVDVVVQTDTNAQITLASGFTFVTAGDIHTVAPNIGQFGTVVTTSGVSLLAGGAAVTNVTLAGVPVRSIVSASNAQVVVVAAGRPAATVGNVVLTMDTGATVTRTNGWAYAQPGAIAAVTPASGQEGTRVTINGTSLLQGAAEAVEVWLAGVQAEEVVASTNTQVVVRAGVNTSLATGAVRIVTDSGAELTQASFAYLNASVITDIQPNNGQGGTIATISGLRLHGGGSAFVLATLASQPATIVSESAQQVVVRAAAASTTGAGHVVLTADTGARTTLELGWTYNAAGAVATVSPASGQQGTYVVIAGTRLLGGGTAATNVTLAGVPATVMFSNATLVRVRAAAGSAGPGDVVIVSDTGATVTQLGGWTYLVPANITAVAPAFGQHGTTVTLTGTNLLGAAIDAATVGGVPVLEVTSATNSQVVVRVGNGTALGQLDIVLTADTGALIERTTAFEARQPGVIASSAPASGQLGTAVTIAGARLREHGASVAQVLFGQTPGTVVSQSDSAVVAAPRVARPAPWSIWCCWPTPGPSSWARASSPTWLRATSRTWRPPAARPAPLWLFPAWASWAAVRPPPRSRWPARWPPRSWLPTTRKSRCAPARPPRPPRGP